MNSYIREFCKYTAAVVMAATIALPIFTNSAHAVRDLTNNVAQNTQNAQRNANQQGGLVNANVPVNANLDLNCAVNVGVLVAAGC